MAAPVEHHALVLTAVDRVVVGAAPGAVVVALAAIVIPLLTKALIIPVATADDIVTFTAEDSVISPLGQDNVWTSSANQYVGAVGSYDVRHKALTKLNLWRRRRLLRGSRKYCSSGKQNDGGYESHKNRRDGRTQKHSLHLLTSSVRATLAKKATTVTKTIRAD